MQELFVEKMTATAVVGCPNRTNVLFLEALLLGKSAQTPMPTGKSLQNLEKGDAPGEISLLEVCCRHSITYIFFVCLPDWSRCLQTSFLYLHFNNKQLEIDFGKNI